VPVYCKHSFWRDAHFTLAPLFLLDRAERNDFDLWDGRQDVAIFVLDAVPNLTSTRVIVLVGQYAGREGICVGKSADGKRWAISPDGTNEIVQLVFEKEFGLLVDLSDDPKKN